MAVPAADLFKKQTVTRQSATSILTSLLSSPKTSCSSPDLSSPCDLFSECDLTSRSESASPVRTPPCKSCLSFAAAPPNSPSRNLLSIVARSKTQYSSEATNPPVLRRHTTKDNIVRIESVSNTRHRPVSVFDDYGEDSSSPVFHDYYRIGQPKKLVDDCLKKEKELRISSTQEEENKDEAVGEVDFKSDEEEDNESLSGDDGDDKEIESECDLDDDDSIIEAATAKSTVNSRLHINTSIAYNILSSSAIYSPLRDIVDNFVPGTLDEDQSELFDTIQSPPSLHDIDPTYPSDNDEDGD